MAKSECFSLGFQYHAQVGAGVQDVLSAGECMGRGFESPPPNQKSCDHSTGFVLVPSVLSIQEQVYTVLLKLSNSCLLFFGYMHVIYRECFQVCICFCPFKSILIFLLIFN